MTISTIGYSDSEKPIIRNGFSAAAFRFGHSMIYHRIQAHNGAIKTSDKLLKDEFLRPDLVYSRGVGEICRGLTRTPSEAVDKYLTEQVTRCGLIWYFFIESDSYDSNKVVLNYASTSATVITVL